MRLFASVSVSLLAAALAASVWSGRAWAAEFEGDEESAMIHAGAPSDNWLAYPPSPPAERPRGPRGGPDGGPPPGFDGPRLLMERLASLDRKLDGISREIQRLRAELKHEGDDEDEDEEEGQAPARGFGRPGRGMPPGFGPRGMGRPPGAPFGPPMGREALGQQFGGRRFQGPPQVWAGGPPRGPWGGWGGGFGPSWQQPRDMDERPAREPRPEGPGAEKGPPPGKPFGFPADGPPRKPGMAKDAPPRDRGPDAGPGPDARRDAPRRDRPEAKGDGPPRDRGPDAGPGPDARRDAPRRDRPEAKDDGPPRGPRPEGFRKTRPDREGPDRPEEASEF